MNSSNLRSRWYKLTHWEFWSFNAIYFPILWYFFLLAARARSFFFFAAANPFIKHGGFLMESKWDIHLLTPPKYVPLTFLIGRSDPFEKALTAAMQIGFPLIAKPDIGGKGRGVAVLQNEQMLSQYHSQCPVDYLLQALIPFENEVGVFYVRHPKTGQGIITGLVQKQMLEVTGDGVSTIADLLLTHARWKVYRQGILHSLGHEAEEVLKSGEARTLVPFGNHARGATFFDITKKVSPELEKTMDAFCRQLPEFHFGRIDIRYKDWDALCRGEDFMVVEINGAGSEPTHMYDPSKTLWQGWMHIVEHWKWLYRVSVANKKRGFSYMRVSEGLQMLCDARAYDRRLDPFQFSAKDTSAS